MSSQNDFSDQARYLKQCFELALHHFLKDEDIELAIVSRTNHLGNGKLTEFEKKLRSCLHRELAQKRVSVNLNSQLKVNTVHKAKGLEADVVIVLQATDRMFPLMHPDNELARLFGQTLRTAYEEELRLFYVAVTRPKDTLYLLSETEAESEFLMRSWNRDTTSTARIVEARSHLKNGSRDQ